MIILERIYSMLVDDNNAVSSFVYSCPMSVGEDGPIEWVDDNSRESVEIDRDSISSEDEASGSDLDGRRVIRTKRTHDIWDNVTLANELQALPGAEDLVEHIKQDDIFEILKSDYALSTAVLLASHMGKPNILKELLMVGANVNVLDSAGRSPLHLASNTGNLECVKLLIEHKANVNLKDITNKITPLHCAASRGHLECLKFLAKSGADINACLNKKTALHYAVESIAIDCVHELLELGAVPNTLQVFTETPLHVAASLGSSEIVQMLIKFGASVNVQGGHDKSTPLHLAAEDGNTESLKLLIDAGAKVSAVNYKQQTPLHIAALCQATESVELLLKNRANPNAKDIDGRTPLHSAIVKVSRSCECVKLLLISGADVNNQDNFGYTALHLAALNEFSNCVLLLINFGGDVTVRTNGGISVLTFITRRTPDVIPRYISKFDNAIKLTDHELGDVDCELKLDFRVLVPSQKKGETELLLNFIEVGHRDVLKHPLCETFLFLKWRRIRKYFIFSLLYHAIYVFLFTAYTHGVFLRNCKSVRHFAVFAINTDQDPCIISNGSKIIGHMLITLNLISLSKELFQIAHNWYVYMKQWENWLQWLIIISVFSCVVPMIDDIRIYMYSWQHHVAAIGIFLAWLELMMIVGRFPIFGLYIQMFTTVAFNFTKFLLAYLCLLIAFTLSFGVLFPNYEPFANVIYGLLKVIVMMSGELEFEDMFYGEDCNGDAIPTSKINYPGTAQFMFILFVLLVTVILTNLMVGLAVSDIQGLQQSAGLDRLVRQAELVAHLESMLFSRLLRWVPSRLLQFLCRHALLLKSQVHSALYIKPNDPREERIPKDLIKNVYELVAEKKERSKRKRRSVKEDNNLNKSNNISQYPMMRVHASNDYIYVPKQSTFFV